MSMINDGGPAFPVSHREKGLSMRDYFAASALQGISAQGKALGSLYSVMAKQAYELADAMIVAREQP
jgi:hypothetical protein